MTISASGVTQYSPDEMSFTPIEHWEREYIFYLKLLKVCICLLNVFFFIYSITERFSHFSIFLRFIFLDKDIHYVSNVESFVRLEEVS